jgi:putative transposase
MGTKTFSQQQKLTILESAKNLGIKEAAKVVGVHYTTIYDWRRQLQSLGEEAFLSYRPKYPGRGTKEIDASQETAILDTWKNRPGFGPGQVRNQLRRQGITISIRTVRKVMKANGYEARTGRKSTESPQRFEAGCPLELIQMDILEFYINKRKVYLILMLDDFSRFICGFELLGETSADAVIKLVQTAVERYGKMQEILTDRGFVFYSWRGINRFERYLQNERIDHTHARPHHPQTLGKVEACNRRIKSELLTQHHFATVDEARSAIEQWVEHYNYERCHQGIGGLLTPAERFHGQAQQVLESIANGVDMTAKNSFTSSGPERSIINVVFAPSGQITLYLMGQPIPLYI